MVTCEREREGGRERIVRAVYRAHNMLHEVRREAVRQKKEAAGNKMAAKYHPPSLCSPQEVAVVGLVAIRRPDRAALARAAPHTSRGSLLNAADILLGLAPSSRVQRDPWCRTCAHAQCLLRVKEACSEKIWRADCAGQEFGRFRTLVLRRGREVAYIVERNARYS